MNKFSELVSELTIVWLKWMKNDEIAKDKNLPYSQRKQPAKKCEELIDREYEIISQINDFFEK